MSKKSSTTKGRVCIITSTHSPFDTRIFHKEAKSLHLAGYKVVIICPHIRNEEKENIQILPVSPPKNRVDRMMILPFRLFKIALKQPADIFHFHDPDLLLIAYLLKRLTPAKVIYDVHENYSEVIKSRSWLPAVFRPLLSKLFGFFEQSLVKTYDGVIAVTEDIDSTFDVKNSVVVRNYPRIDLFDSQQIIDDPQRELKPPRLIYVGDLTKVRGIHEIVRSLEYLEEDNPLELILIGGFSEGNLEDSLKSLPCYSRVRHLGRIPYAEVSEHLHKADIGLVCLHPIPRYQKALPVKMFEYMAAGLPVVASDFPIWRTILEENQCGLVVDPTSPEAIANAYQYLINHPDQSKKMGLNGKKAVSEKYSWSAEQEKLLGLYSGLLQD